MIMKEWVDILRPGLAKIVLFAGIFSVMPLPVYLGSGASVELFGFPRIMYALTNDGAPVANMLYALLGACFSYLVAAVVFHAYELSLTKPKAKK